MVACGGFEVKILEAPKEFSDYLERVAKAWTEAKDKLAEVLRNQNNLAVYWELNPPTISIGGLIFSITSDWNRLKLVGPEEVVSLLSSDIDIYKKAEILESLLKKKEKNIKVEAHYESPYSVLSGDIIWRWIELEIDAWYLKGRVKLEILLETEIIP